MFGNVTNYLYDNWRIQQQEPVVEFACNQPEDLENRRVFSCANMGVLGRIDSTTELKATL